MNRKKIAAICLAGGAAFSAFASDHDDGEMELKGRNLNLTDLYAFRQAEQQWDAGAATRKGALVLIMNTNPRSIPHQEYFFSTQATYDFHITRVKKKSAIPTGEDQIKISMTFGAPNDKGQQEATVVLVKDGSSKTLGKAMTTSLPDSLKDKLTVSKLQDGVDFFAGLREDPFFFDVDQFFKVRAAAIATGKLSLGFLPPEQASDFAHSLNVNTIVLSVPVTMLESAAKEVVFDVWETVSIPGKDGTLQQLDRIGRPAINEGLVIHNANLNAFNSIPPTLDLATKNPTVLAVLKEASASLDLLDSLDGKLQFKKGFDSNVVKGFLPDVLRVDTSVIIPPGKAAYNGDFIVNDLGAPMLTGGRKIEDDVIDITLSYVIAGDVTGQAIKDNVSYAGTPGNPSQGHKMLYQQKERLGKAQFPFLATPN